MKEFFVLLLTLIRLSNACGQSPINEKSIQKPEFGVFISGNHLSMTVNQYVNDQYLIYNNSKEQYQGMEVGTFTRYQLTTRFRIKSTLSYLKNTYFIQFKNLKAEEEIAQGASRAWIFSGPIYSFQRISLSLSGEYLVREPFYVQAGVLVSRQITDKAYSNKDESFFQNQYNQADRILYSYAESFKQFNTSGQVGIGVDLRRFVLEANYERSISYLNGPLNVNKVSFNEPQHFSIWKVSAGFRLNK
ncbi:hypothetical protein [Spirosoma utsteinense]|uniref:Outer membrane protein beta-barrel domain-containing protein n=1 Tax=Spirosoma utsteinense TaxID=2585773 RepID=A0ABR6WCE4_9BACT|nr:hypothetical protein [Spirosoma utsteinense]MBC3788332.1 hypothetical protein [Spirosoma utsteinense]MBC3794249.1 hypothetical protein [Spirosoma utsteinense]